jgi:predicted transcriptional regulator
MKLFDYLKKNKKTPVEFASEVGVCTATIYNVMKGKDILLSLAHKIHVSTGHKVSYKDLLNDNPPPRFSLGWKKTTKKPE